MLKAVPALPTLGNAAGRQEKPQRRERTQMQRKKEEKKKRTDELSDEGGIKPWGRRGCKLQKGSARSQPPPKTTGEATKGKCHCTRTLKCAVRHKLGKPPISFPSSSSISVRRRKHTQVLAAP